MRFDGGCGKAPFPAAAWREMRARAPAPVAREGGGGGLACGIARGRGRRRLSAERERAWGKGCVPPRRHRGRPRRQRARRRAAAGRGDGLFRVVPAQRRGGVEPRRDAARDGGGLPCGGARRGLAGGGAPLLMPRPRGRGRVVARRPVPDGEARQARRAAGVVRVAPRVDVPHRRGRRGARLRRLGAVLASHHHRVRARRPRDRLVARRPRARVHRRAQARRRRRHQLRWRAARRGRGRAGRRGDAPGGRVAGGARAQGVQRLRRCVRCGNLRARRQVQGEHGGR